MDKCIYVYLVLIETVNESCTIWDGENPRAENANVLITFQENLPLDPAKSRFLDGRNRSAVYIKRNLNNRQIGRFSIFLRGTFVTIESRRGGETLI